MFFFLSKTLNYLVMPTTVLITLVLLSLLVRHHVWRRRIRVTTLVVLFVFTNDFIANELMRAWEVRATPYRDMTKHRIGIVLTGTMVGGLEPDDRVYFSRGADRVVHTVQLYKMGLIDQILVSGGVGRLFGTGVPEAEKFRDAMMLMGVPDSVIIVESASRNTAESAVNVIPILQELGYTSEDCLLITSAFHMRRSLACFQKQGLQLAPFSTDFYAASRSRYGFQTYFLPQLGALVLWHKLVKEWVGMVAYWVAGYV